MKNYRKSGVHVLHAKSDNAGQRPPLLLVHGGLHGSWCWEKYLPVFTASGWDCHALDWFGHHESEPLPPEQLVQRGIADVTEEIGVIADALASQPVVIGHSMGGLASMKYAESHTLPALVLLSPVLPAAIGNLGNSKVPFEIDLTQPWGPPPFEVAKEMFFKNVSEDDARRYFALLSPESPRCVAEATGRQKVDVDGTKIDCPVLIIVGEDDTLTPADRVEALAKYLNADFSLFPGRSHDILLDPQAEGTAMVISNWLTGRLEI